MAKNKTLTAKQKKNQSIFKEGVREYKKYKKSNKNGTKKLGAFIKDAFAAHK